MTVYKIQKILIIRYVFDLSGKLFLGYVEYFITFEC